MARFDVQEQYPKSTDYRESRPISPYSGAASGNWDAWGKAFAAAGEVYKSAVTGYDAYQEELVKQSTRQIAERNRDDYTDRLENQYDKVGGTGRGMYTEAPPVISGDVEVGGASRLPPAGAGQRNLFAEDPVNVPPAIENRLGRLKTLGSARGNGSISNTDYWGRVDSELKDLRSKFPNYADVIDRQASAILGTNPANAYVTGLVSDINSFIKQGASEQTKVRSEIWKANDKGYTGMPQTLIDYNAGKISETEVMERINKQAAVDRQYQLLDIQRKTVGAHEEIAGTKAATQAEFLVNTKANTYLDTISWGPGFTGREGFAGYLESIRTNKTKAPGQQESLQIVQRINEAEAKFVIDANKEFDRTDGRVGGRSLTSDLKGKTADKNAYIEQGKAMFKYFRDNVSKDNVTLAQAGELYRKAATSDRVNHILSKEEFRPILDLGEISKLMPSTAQEIAESYLKNKNKGAGTVEKLTEFVFKQNIDIANPYNPTTPIGAIRNIEKVDTPTPTPGAPRTAQPPPRNVDAYDGVIKQIEMISKPEIEDAQKVNLFNKTFSPDGMALINKFAKEGAITKYGVWNRLASPDMASEIKRLSGLPGNAGMFERYNEWMKTTFANDIFGQDIRDLDVASQGDKVTIGWNDKTYNFTPAKVDSTTTSPEGVPMRSKITRQGDTGKEREINAIIARLNAGLTALSNVARAAGENPNDYIVELFAGMGYQPMRRDVRSGATTTNVAPGLPEKMYTAILAEQMKALRDEEERKQKAKEYKK